MNIYMGTNGKAQKPPTFERCRIYWEFCFIRARNFGLGKLKEVFRRHRSRPVEGLIAEINPILRGWVNYFAVGHSSRCFSYIRDWVEKKIRRHLARACQRRGFGWQRWSKEWLYETLGLFNEYRVAYRQSFSNAVASQ